MGAFNQPLAALSYSSTVLNGQKIRAIPASWTNPPDAWTPFYQGPAITPGQTPTFPGGALTMRLGPAGPLLGATPLPGSAYLSTGVANASGMYTSGGTGGGPMAGAVAAPSGNPWDPRTSATPWAVAALTVGLLMLRFVVHL